MVYLFYLSDFINVKCIVSFSFYFILAAEMSIGDECEKAYNLYLCEVKRGSEVSIIKQNIISNHEA